MDDRITIIRSDITDLTTDCIVNAANEGLAEGGGVCGAIFRAAGSAKLRAACERIGGCPAGSAVITPGFDLAAAYIIHAVGPRWHGGGYGEREKLYSCYQAAMELAREHDCRSIAFPLISAGIFGYPLEEAWEVAIESVRDWFDREPSCDIRVVFAVRDESKMAAGERILRSTMTQGGKQP